MHHKNKDLAAAATAHVLADLHLQGWRMRLDDRQLWVIPPPATVVDGERAETIKERLKTWLQAGRSAQIAESAVQAFIAKMHTPRVHKRRRVSVLDLMDDGHSLAAELSEFSRLPPSERPDHLRRLVRPQLEFVEAQAVCNETGLLLMDIWRYFRHTWPIEYRPTPGRSLLFLIRNGARPNRPIMAIGSLANATLQSRVREDWIGWSAEKMRARVSNSPDIWPKMRTRFMATLASEIRNIRTDDLYDLARGTEGAALEKRLYSIADESKRMREHELRDRQSRSARGESIESFRRLPTSEDGTIAWDEAAQSPLFKAKRAKTLADLLFAERILKSTKAWTKIGTMSEEFSRAFAVATREIRKVGLASRLLELNVCGAVPPYNDLLAGKLAALAVASREIFDAYGQRYDDKVSEVSSQMAGREVTRSSEICVIMTTSLYAVSSSQYNRLNITIQDRNRSQAVKWEELGITSGYGTTHFSEPTVRALRAFSISRRGGRNVEQCFRRGTKPPT
jgi:hypothetical protein